MPICLESYLGIPRDTLQCNTVGEIQTTSSQEKSSPQDIHTHFALFVGSLFTLFSIDVRLKLWKSL